MRRLIHLMLSPSCRLARLIVAEKRVTCDPVLAEDGRNPLPVLVDLDGTEVFGVLLALGTDWLPSGSMNMSRD